MWDSIQGHFWVHLHSHPAQEGLLGACIWIWWRQDQEVELCKNGTEKSTEVMALGFYCTKEATFSLLCFASPLTTTEWHLKRKGRNNLRLNSEVGTCKQVQQGREG